jgi:hypothetical protein
MSGSSSSVNKHRSGTPFGAYSHSGVIAAVAFDRKGQIPLRLHLYVDMSCLSERLVGACASAGKDVSEAAFEENGSDDDRLKFGLLA